MDFLITEFTRDDFAQVTDIYQQGIDTGIATFQTQTKSWQQWEESFLPHSRLVARRGKDILGWATLSSVSSRACYAGVAEVTVYVGSQAQGQGVGKALLNALVNESENNGIWTLQAGIFSTNEASIKLHERCGFRIVGVRKRIAQLHGRWVDTVLMEKRSERIGAECFCAE